MSDKQSQVTQPKTQLPSKEQVSKCFDLMMQSQFSWEKLLLPTIESITILSELIQQAARSKDIKLNQGSANKKSKFQNPQSLSSCLMNICNQTVKSFQETRNNLEQMQISCEGITVHVKNVAEGSTQDKDFHCQLSSIKSCADQCKEKADSVVTELSNLSDLFSELLEMCAASQIASQDKLEEVRKTLEETKQRNELIEKEKEDLDKEWNEVSQKRQELRNEYTDVNSSAFVDELCLEGLKKMKELLPKIIELASRLTNPIMSLEELRKGVMFLIELSAQLSSKEFSESNTEINNFLKTVREQAAAKIQEVQCKLEESNNNYQKCLDKMKSLGEENETFLREIKDNRTEESNISTSLELMVKGLGALGSIKTHWSKMINFIQIIPKVIEDCLKALQELGAVGDGGTLSAPGMLTRSQIQVYQAVSTISIIGAMSKNYVEIYDKYLKNPLRDLRPLLLGQGPEHKFKQIQKKCCAAREEIQKKVTKNQEEFRKNGIEAIEKLT
ncbi:TATA element modulatory factor-like [Carcharodon carcharias]|uniref:TATA element modulatory factor-like n=1 Tax=Carcharodon carcharias TaxID=13397 RepID=UPI001B7E5A7D|nr:TATA element modulatory factor-like [Carcharodon carcharias]